MAFVNRAPDSLWTWAVTPGENLMAHALSRGGQILVSVTEPTMGLLGETVEWPVFRRGITAVQAIADGDPGTAFDPDEFGLSRQSVDLHRLGRGLYHRADQSVPAPRRRTYRPLSADF